MCDSNSIIQLINCTKTYKQGSESLQILKSVNCTISKGEYISIIGPSGSGKSTFLNIVGSLNRPTSGDVLIQSQSILEYSDEALSDIRAKKIGFIFQQFHLIPHLNILDNVLLPFQYTKPLVTNARKLANDALSIVGLKNKALASPKVLSGGEMQRVAIARAIVTKPLILLADEPTGSLDHDNAELIMDILHKLNNQGTALVVVTHNLEIARRATRQIVCSNGELEERVSTFAT